MMINNKTANSLKVLLIGIGGVYNYGCEAIVRGTEAIIRKEYPQATIVYASRRPIDDKKRLSGSKVQIINRGKINKYSVKSLCRKALLLFGVHWDPRIDSLKLLNGVDAVFSIGGDLYTLNHSKSFSMSFPKFGDAARAMGLPYVLWGASIGPFSENPSAEKAYTKHLKGLNLITARESTTIDYLRSLGICDNVVPCADPAYMVAPEICAKGSHQNDRLTLGINLSPLSARFMKCSLAESIRRQAFTIQNLIKQLETRIVLIPHVVCDFAEGDDDLRYLRKIKAAIAPEYQEAVSLLNGDPGFIGVKKEILKCDLVLAARMHCAINALAAHVPTLLIAYSSKAEGMGRYVYGHDQWVMPLESFTHENILLSKLKLMISRHEEIRAYLARRLSEIREDAFHPMHCLKKLLSVSEPSCGK